MKYWWWSCLCLLACLSKQATQRLLSYTPGTIPSSAGQTFLTCNGQIIAAPPTRQNTIATNKSTCAQSYVSVRLPCLVTILEGSLHHSIPTLSAWLDWYGHIKSTPVSTYSHQGSSGPVVQASRRGEGRGQLRVRLNIDIIQQQPSLSQCRPAVPAQIAAHHPPTAQLVGQQ